VNKLANWWIVTGNYSAAQRTKNGQLWTVYILSLYPMILPAILHPVLSKSFMKSVQTPINKHTHSHFQAHSSNETRSEQLKLKTRTFATTIAVVQVGYL